MYRRESHIKMSRCYHITGLYLIHASLQAPLRVFGALSAQQLPFRSLSPSVNIIVIGGDDEIVASNQ